MRRSVFSKLRVFQGCLVAVATTCTVVVSDRVSASIAVVASGVVDANSSGYLYAPAFVTENGSYRYYACGNSGAGDVISYKSSTSLAGLQSAARSTILTGNAQTETHACDPSVVKGPDGRYFLHYTIAAPNMAGTTETAVAVSTTPTGPWTKLGKVLTAPAGTPGKTEPSVTRGHDGAYYLAYLELLNANTPTIVIVRSVDPSFRAGFSEVGRYTVPGPLNIGFSPTLSYDPSRGVYLMSGAESLRLNVLSTAFQVIGQYVFAGTTQPGEGQALLTNPYGELVYLNGLMTFAGSTYGPTNRGYIPSITGPNTWYQVPRPWFDADWSGDGKPDLLGVVSGSGTMCLYRGNGAGSLSSGFGCSEPVGFAWTFSKIVYASDWSGDGKPDVLAVNSSGQLLMYRGNGAAGWITGTGEVIGTGWNIFSTILYASDWSGDGKPDLLARDTAGNLLMYRGNGIGGFIAGTGQLIGSGWNIFSQIVYARDWNGDGRPDLLATGPDGSLFMYRGNGAGGWITGLSELVGSGWLFNPLVEAGDWTGDGNPDLLGVDANGVLCLYRGNGSGGIASGFSCSEPLGSGWNGFSTLMVAGRP